MISDVMSMHTYSVIDRHANDRSANAMQAGTVRVRMSTWYLTVRSYVRDCR